MRVAIVSTYPPRACGIGTFSRDLREALLGAEGVTAVDLAAIVRDPDAEQAPEVAVSIAAGRSEATTPRRPGVLDRRGVDVVVIEHEYGIFGGPDGEHVLSLARRAAPTDRVDPAHGPVRSIGPPSGDAAGAVRPLHARVRLHRDGSAHGSRSSPRAPGAGACGAARGPDRVAADGQRAPAHCGCRAATPTSPCAPSTRTGASWPPSGSSRRARASRPRSRPCPRSSSATPRRCTWSPGRPIPRWPSSTGEEYRLSLERLARDLDLGDHVHFRRSLSHR